MSFEFDHAYLRATVAAPLTEAMAQLAVLQPEDPVEFLGQFLLKYVDTELQKQELARLQQLHPTRAASTPLNYTEGNSIGDTDQAELARLLSLEQALQDKLPVAETLPDLCDAFLPWLATALGAEEAYVGRKVVDPVGGGALIHWIASSRGAASVTVDKVLTETAENVTFDVFKEVTASPEDGPSETVDTEGNAPPPVVPKFLHVENVLREPRIKFFHVPKLGAYLTRGLQFKSFLHADVFNESNLEEPVIKDEWIVVSADTMGQARAFTSLEIESFQRATLLFAQTLETLERKLYMVDVERKTTNGEDALLKEFNIAFVAQVSVQEENLMLQVQSLPEDDKTLKEAEMREASMTFLLQSHLRTLALASAHVVPFKPSVLVVFATAMILLGYGKADLSDPATKLPSWNKMAPLLSEEQLKPRLESFSVPATRVVALAKQQLDNAAKSEVASASPIAGSWFTWISAVFAHADQVEAAAERARVAAQEAEAAAAGEEE